MATDIELYPHSANFAPTAETDVDNFARYRELTDSDSRGVRKTGLFDPTLYADSLADFRTISVDHDGMQFPVLTPIKYVAGYDLSRCRELTHAASEEQCFYVNITPSLFFRHQEEILGRLSRGVMPDYKLFFDYAQDDHVAAAIYEGIMTTLPQATAEVEFHNEDVSTQPSAASLSFFTARVTHLNPTEVVTGEEKDIKTVFDERVSRGEALLLPLDGMTLLRPNEIDERLFQEMWELYKSRFQWLGSAHPISMEDTEEEFRELLYSSNAIVPVSFRDGKPVCFTYLFDNIDACSWLKPEFIRAHTEPGRQLWFFGGIVATADGIGGHSKPLIQLITELASQTGMQHEIAFESTDVSEWYIPGSVYDYINGTGVSLCEQPRKISQHVYRARTITN